MDHGETREPIDKEVRFLVPIEKGDSPQRVTYGVVLEPDIEDLQGDVMTAEDIEKAAYDWMERSQHGGCMHASLVEGAKVVESYIAPCDIPVQTAGGTETIKKGSWVLAMRWPPEIWESIQEGELTGYSVGGSGVRLEIEKHGGGDQSPHGNWARGRMTPAEEGNAAGRRDAGENARRDEAEGSGRPTKNDWIRTRDGRVGFISDDYGDQYGLVLVTDPPSEGEPSQLSLIQGVPAEKVERLTDPAAIREARTRLQAQFPGADIPDVVAKHGSHDQSTHGNWARGGRAGTEATGAGRGGAHKVGDVVRLKEDGAVGVVVDYAPGKDGALDEYAIAPEDLEEGGPRAIWFRADEIETAQGPASPSVGDTVTFRDGVEAKVVGLSQEHVLVEGPGVPNGTMAVGYDDIDSGGNITLDAEYKPRYRGQYERPSAYGGSLEEGDDALDGYPSGTVDDEEMYPTGGRWQGEDGAEAEEAEWKAGYGRDASQGWEADAGYKTFTRGQKVRTPTGKIRTVHSQRGAQAFVEEESNGWYHPSKLWPVKKSDKQEVLADAVREGLRDAVAKHGSHDQREHGNWARGGRATRALDARNEVDLDELFDGSKGKTVTLDGHEYTIKEIKPFKHVPGIDTVVLEPKDKNSDWYRETRRQLRDDWYQDVSDPERLVELASQLPGGEKLRRSGVKKHGSGDQSPHGNWAKGGSGPKKYRTREGDAVTVPESDDSTARPEDEERDEELRRSRRTHTTRDGIVIEDQPKVQRIRGSEAFASSDGTAQLNYGEWKWLAAGESRGAAKNPKLHERGRWGAWPRGADRSNIENVVWSQGSQTLAEFINSLDPGEYDLAT